MQPYVIRQGDYLQSLAYQFGFDADTVWNDPKNANLRQLRSSPNILWPTDILYIPDQITKQPDMKSLTAGTTNTFVSDPPTVTISLQFTDSQLVSQAYSIQELPRLTGLTTGPDGGATFSIPVTLNWFTVVFTESGTTFEFNTGSLDPIDTLSGVFQRLQNLGYIDLDAANGPSLDMNLIRSALRAFKAATHENGAPISPDPSAASTPSPAGDSDPLPPSGSISSPASSPYPLSDDSSPDPISSQASDPWLPAGTDIEDPPSDLASSPAPSTEVQDTAGLNDDGTLEEATSKLLLDAHLS